MSDHIHLERIRPETARLFSVLSSFAQLEDLTLIGGTALALIIGHRLSNDLDFACFGDRLPTDAIESLIAELKAGGLRVQLITDPEQISNFKIRTGKRLLSIARDYMVGDTKVTFFAMGAKQSPNFMVYLSNAPTLDLPDTSFKVLSLDPLKVTKAVVIGQRVKSRDLYDLFILSQKHDYSVSQLLQDAVAYGSNDDPEYYKAVLRGDIPLDQDDEGLEPVEVKATLEDIYRYFDTEISALEIEEAARIARALDE